MVQKFIIFLIRCYQVIPFSSHDFCRCYPKCSDYMIEAITTYGTIKGCWLGFKRIINCRPGGLYGYQPLEKEKF